MKIFSRRLFQLLVVVLLVTGQPPMAASQASARADASPAVHLDTVASGQALQTLDSLLRPDGTLNLHAGFNGSLDPRGWRMISQSGEPPRFVRAESTEGGIRASASLFPAAAGDEFWDDRFDALGVSGYVNTLAVSGDDVYVGGRFDAVGSLEANNIARWNSVEGKWYLLGTAAANGTNGPVHAIAIYRDYIYVGGAFTSAGNVTAYNIARWNSTYNTWSAVGVGMNNTVRALAIDPQGIVYAGGDFGDVEGPNSQYLAAWVGGHWTALGVGVSGPSGPVYAIALSTIGSTVVYVGGKFLDAGGKPNTEYIAAFAAGSWWPVGNGLSNTVYALAVSGDNVYAGGEFGDVGTPNTHNFARWNGSAWFPVGAGVSGTVRTIALVGNDVYIGGEFLSAGGENNTLRIARWDGSGWSALGSGVIGYVNDIAAGVDGVYVGGLFNAAGGKPSRNFGRWSGHLPVPPNPCPNWDDRFGPDELGLGPLFPGAWSRAIATGASGTYVGGGFTTAGGVPVNRITRWDGNGWSALGSGKSDTVNAIAIGGNSDVYAGGFFPLTVSRWDGSNWYALGSGTDGVVDAIAVSGNNVYVGGGFSYAGGILSRGLARWDGSHWLPIGANGEVYSIAVAENGYVYVGGSFTSVGGVSANNIARWNNIRWQALGSGTNGQVRAVAVSGSDVYIGGFFTMTAGISTNNIARWDGNSWHALGSGTNKGVLSLAAKGSTLIAGGWDFTTAGGVSARGIARWNGHSWSPLCSGIPGYVHAVAISGSDVLAAGNFNTAGGKPSQLFGIYHTGSSSWGGIISGRVTGPGGVPIPGAPVQVCRPLGGPCQWIGTSDSNGIYTARNLPAGPYRAAIYPPANSLLRPNSTGTITLPENTSLSGQDIVLRDYQPVSNGVSLIPSRLGSLVVPRVSWSQPLFLAAQGCSGGSASYQITQGGAVLRSGALAETPAGRYSAGIIPLAPYAGDAEAHITIQCPAGLAPQAETVKSFDLYIEPDFTVRTLSGRPLAGASVTLYSYDNATGSFQAVPNGDARMGPINRANPDTTDSSGQFGWDLSAGIYKIRAAKAGCALPGYPPQAHVESEVLVIPEDGARDINLYLDCGVNNAFIYLPMVRR